MFSEGAGFLPAKEARRNERGGYVTSETENLGAYLTLDSEDGQVFMAYANANGNDKRDSISLTTYEQPRIQMRQNGKIVQKIPGTAPELR